MSDQKLPPVLLAIILQIVPLSRALLPAQTATPVGFAILLRWMAGASALFGSYDSVSGASTVITSKPSAMGTNGVPFTYRITTGPEVGNQYNATPLPPGLTINTASGKISGTPTAPGVTVATLTASDSGLPERTVQATLTITIIVEGAIPPSIFTQPLGQTATEGSMAIFAVEADGTAPFSFQWMKDSEPLTGATNDVLMLNPVSLDDAGSYTVTVSNNAGSITSAAAELIVEATTIAPSITEPPSSQTVLAGADVMFTASATGTPPLSYQWSKDNTPLSGARSATLTLDSVSVDDSGSYTVSVSNSASSVTSSPAELIVQAPRPTALRLNDPVLVGSALKFQLTGPTNVNAIVWVSNDLTLWTPLSTNAVGPSGNDYTDPAGLGRRFFRATIAPP